MALAERALAGEFPGLVDHHTWVMLGDGCLQEGLGQEAISLAGHLGLGKLNLLYDDNDITIDGPTSISFSEDVPARFRACGWHVISCDGHDANALDAAMTAAKAETARPTLIAMKTIIGFGSPNRAGTAKAHGAPLGEEEGALAKAALDWNAAPFEIPADLAASWKEIGTRGAAEREAWEAKLAASSHAQAFRDRIAGKLPDNYENDVDKARNALFETPQKVATRKASQIALEHLASAVPAMIGGSADLTGSNLTRVSAVDSQFTAEMPGRYIGYGVREFGMAAAMNGLALHGGFKPYGGTFLVFSDYARNAIRLSALMGLGVTYVMTHDSIGLGEDGPTHQPVEHPASTTPSLMALSRQEVPQLRETGTENLTRRGAYIIRQFGKDRNVTLLATGTEVSLAIDAAQLLHAEGYSVAVVSMPCWELFDAQDDAYRAATLGDAPRIAIEAASAFGWTRYVDREADVIGMPGFGASAPAERLYEEFGITTNAIVTLAKAKITQ
jgi:transketolase